MEPLAALRDEIVSCRACPRLVAWREEVATTKRAAFRDETYWGRPVPGFGDPAAELVVIGLAPAAHGANRTGRMFTGDRSGEWLYRALWRAGYADRPTSVSRDDGLTLRDTYIVCALRCAPPANAPRPDELARCARFLDAEAALLPRVRVVLALGAIGWRAWLEHVARLGHVLPRPRPAFSHGARVDVGGTLLLGSYHVSQQNTQTGKLTPAMFDAVLKAAKSAAGA